MTSFTRTPASSAPLPGPTAWTRAPELPGRATPPAPPALAAAAAVRDGLDQGARVHGEAEPLGDLGWQRHRPDAEVGGGYLARLYELVGDGDRGIRGDGEPEVHGAGLRGREVGDVYAHDVAVAVHEGAARVAGRDGGVGLDQVHQRARRLLVVAHELPGKLAPHGADDAGGHGRLEAGRAADGDGALAHDGRVGRPGGRRRQDATS